MSRTSPLRRTSPASSSTRASCARTLLRSGVSSPRPGPTSFPASTSGCRCSTASARGRPTARGRSLEAATGTRKQRARGCGGIRAVCRTAAIRAAWSFRSTAPLSPDGPTTSSTRPRRRRERWGRSPSRTASQASCTTTSSTPTTSPIPGSCSTDSAAMATGTSTTRERRRGSAATAMCRWRRCASSRSSAASRTTSTSRSAARWATRSSPAKRPARSPPRSAASRGMRRRMHRCGTGSGLASRS